MWRFVLTVKHASLLRRRIVWFILLCQIIRVTKLGTWVKFRPSGEIDAHLLKVMLEGWAVFEASSQYQLMLLAVTSCCICHVLTTLLKGVHLPVENEC